MQAFVQNLAVALVVLLAVALPSANGQLQYNASFAIDAGFPACPNVTACPAGGSVYGCSSPSYVTAAGGPPPFNFANNNNSALTAVPFRVRDGYTFEVSGLSLHFGLTNKTYGPTNMSVYFYAASTTNASLPGAAVPGWATGKIFTFNIQYQLKPAPASGSNVGIMYKMSTSIPAFNLTQGLYYAMVVTWGSTLPNLYGNYLIDGYPQPGAYWANWNGFTPYGNLFPNSGLLPNWRWEVTSYTVDAVPCLWPTGRLWNQLGNPVSTAPVASPSPSPSPTPTPNVWVRYPLETDLNDLVPSEFAVSVSDYFHLSPDSQVQVIRAVRAQVPAISAADTSPQPSPTAGTVVDFAVVNNGTASYDIMAQVANVTSLEELRLWNVSIAASPTLVPVYNITV